MSSPPIPGSEDPQSGRRKSSRLRLFLPAVVEEMTGSGPSSIWNLSTIGAQISTESVLRVGSDVILKYGPIDALCLVVWANGNTYGLEFEEPVTEDAIVFARCTAEHQPEQQERARLAAAKGWSEGA